MRCIIANDRMMLFIKLTFQLYNKSPHASALNIEAHTQGCIRIEAAYEFDCSHTASREIIAV